MDNNPPKGPDSLDTKQDKGTISIEDIQADVKGNIERAEQTSYKEITGEQLLKMEVQEIPRLVEPFFQQVGLVCLAGSSDTGKSCLLRQLAIAIVTGEKEFIGFSTNTKHNSVIFVPTEDGRDATAYLLQQQAKQYKPEFLKGLRFIFDYENLLNEIGESLTRNPADAVIIDCFQDVFGGGYKESDQIRAFLHPYQQLAEKHQCLVIFLHHTAKRTENLEPSKNNLLSGQGFEAKMRLVIELRADPHNPDHRHLCIVKGNYLSGRHKRESYVLEFDERTFTFNNTNERTPFELLIKHPNDDNSKAKYEQAKELKDQGHTYKEIAEKLGYGSPGTITKLFQKAERNNW